MFENKALKNPFYINLFKIQLLAMSPHVPREVDLGQPLEADLALLLVGELVEVAVADVLLGPKTLAVAAPLATRHVLSQALDSAEVAFQASAAGAL